MPDHFIVTGGAGLIGSNVVAALNQRGIEDITVVDHLNHPDKQRNLDQLRFKQYLDRDGLRAQLRAGKLEKASGVFHLGACSSTTETDNNYLQDNNLRYTQEICSWCLEHDARFVYASSAATYGDGELGYSDADEVTPTLKPLNLYGQSKQDFDLWAMKNQLLGKIAGLKYFNVYGPGEDHKGSMRSMVNKAYAQIKEKGEMGLFKSYHPDYKDGESLRDFVHVFDAAKVTLFLYDHPEANGIFNCGTGKARSWNDLAKAIFAALGQPAKIKYIEMPENLRNQYQYYTQAEMAKLRNAGYREPFLSLEDGVKQYVQEYLIR